MSRIFFGALVAAAVAVTGGPAGAAGPIYKGRPISQLMSSGGRAALQGRAKTSVSPMVAVAGDEEDENPWINPDAPLEGFPSLADEGGEPRGGGTGNNVFVNDPCMDPPPPNRARTVQSETELAVLNGRHSHGKKIVVGYNDSWGFYNNTQGLSGYAYSIDGGRTFIDGGGLPPAVPGGGPIGTPGEDTYAGDPVVVVHNRTETFYYASIYLTPNGFQTLAVNRGRFKRVPPRPPPYAPESKSNTRCAGHPERNGIPDPPTNQERIVWEPPVVAVSEAELGGGPSPDPALADALDKEWLYVDQRTGVLYLTYTRFGVDGSTPIEMVRSYDGGQTWTPPSVIVPNLPFGFNQATQAIVTSTGRVLVTWHARIFAGVNFTEVDQEIQAAFSDNDGATFGLAVTVTKVKPQGEPLGYNRRRFTILDAPFLNGERRGEDGEDDDGDDEGQDERRRHPGFVYVAYFDGKTALPQVIPPGATSQGPGNPFARQADRMKKAGLDALVSISPESFAYVTGFLSPTQPLMRWRHAMAVVTAEGRAALVAVDMEAITIRAKAPPGTEIAVWHEFKFDAMSVLADALRKHGLAGSHIGIEMDYLPAGDFADLREIHAPVRGDFNQLAHETLVTFARSLGVFFVARQIARARPFRQRIDEHARSTCFQIVSVTRALVSNLPPEARFRVLVFDEAICNLFKQADHLRPCWMIGGE